MSYAIELSNVCKTYPRRWLSAEVTALKGVSLTIEAGEVFGFIGANGAGKTTTIKILMGLVFPTSGQISIFGNDVSAPAARAYLGYVPESPSLPDHLTPFELLSFALSAHQVGVPDRKRHVSKWLDRLGLSQVANKLIRGFSKGMCQRTALAHAFCVQPKLLILDEPLSGLDPIGRRDVVEILDEYRHSGGTIFLTSHVLHDVERLADRFGLIHEGTLRSVKSPSELLGLDEVVVLRSQGTGPALNGMTAESGGRWTIQMRRSELWTALDRLRDEGHSLIEIRPMLSLETAFLNAVRQEGV